MHAFFRVPLERYTALLKRSSNVLWLITHRDAPVALVWTFLWPFGFQSSCSAPLRWFWSDFTSSTSWFIHSWQEAYVQLFFTPRTSPRVPIVAAMTSVCTL
jgi:hypothetical protein